MTIDTNGIEFQKAVAEEVAKQLAEEVSKLKGIEKIGFKQTMNQQDIKDYHIMLKNKESLSDISKALLIDEKTLKKFTPDVVEKFKRQKQAALNAMLAKHAAPQPAVAGGDSVPQPNLTEKQQAKQDKAKVKA